MCCTRTAYDGRMLYKQQYFQEKRCCVAELTLQNLFVLSYINTTYISITINAFSDTLSGASPSDKNVSVTSEKTAPRYHQGMNFVGSILQHSTIFLEILLFREHSPITVSPCAKDSLGAYLGATNTEDPELPSPAKIWKIFWDKSGTGSGNVL